jgi:hypothetical protein
MPMRPINEVSWVQQPPRARSRRRLWIGLLVLLVVLSAGYAGWWLYAVSAFRDRTLAWIEDRRADGWRLDYAEMSRRGFPLKLGLRFDKPVAGSPDAALTWTASRALLSTRVFSGKSIRLAIKGDQGVEFVGATAAGGARQRYSGRAGKFAFDFVPAAGWMPNGRLSIRDLSATGEGGGESLALARLDLVSRGDPAAASGPTVSTYSVALSARGLRLAEFEAVSLCGEVAYLTVDAKLLGGLEPAPWPTSLAKWRDDGGVVEATRLDLACGPLTLAGGGTFALDPAGQPIGAMATRIQGYDAALDRLAADGIVAAHTAAAAKILLRAMARSGDGGPALATPVSIQDRTLSVGPVPLLRLSAVHWLDGVSKTR